MHNAETLFIDLDGTLTDPKEGITKSIQFALEQMGHPSPSLDNLTQFIGPPLRNSFNELLGAARVEAAIQHFLQRYDIEGMCLTENVVYPGMIDVLSALQEQRKKLFIVTAKTQVIADRIVQHFGLDGFFQHVYGAELDETRSNKVELIAHILEQEKIAPENVVMIGDRKHDILGATLNNIRSIGVGWGYGTLEELKTAGATAIVQHPNELLEILLGPEPRPAGMQRRPANYTAKA